MSRTVIVASSAANKAKKITTSATTWGELQNEISDLITGDVEAVVKPGNITLRANDSTLPEGDFNVYLIPKKNKAGYDADDFVDDIAEEVERFQGAQLQALKAAVIAAIRGFAGQSAEKYEDDDLSNALNEAREME